jgi:hypothetical protein
MSQKETSWRYSFVGALFAVLPLLIVWLVFRIQIDPRQSEKIMIESQGWSSLKTIHTGVACSTTAGVTF